MLFVYQLGEHAEYLSSIMNDMNKEYRNAGNKGLVYRPCVGKLQWFKYIVFLSLEQSFTVKCRNCKNCFRLQIHFLDKTSDIQSNSLPLFMLCQQRSQKDHIFTLLLQLHLSNILTDSEVIIGWFLPLHVVFLTQAFVPLKFNCNPLCPFETCCMLSLVTSLCYWPGITQQLHTHAHMCI